MTEVRWQEVFRCHSLPSKITSNQTILVPPSTSLLSYHCCQRFSVVLFLKTTHVSTRIQINICYYQFCLALLYNTVESWQNAPYQLDNHDQISTTGRIKTRGQRKRHDSYSWPQLLIRCVVSLTPGRWSGHHDDNASLLSSAATRTVARLSVFCDLSARNILLHGRAKTVMELFQIFITSLFGGGALYSAWTAESQFTGP